MPVVEVSLPDELRSEFEKLVDEEFVSEEQAAEELLRRGIDAYSTNTGDDSTRADDVLEGAENNLFDTANDPGSIDDDSL
ncbi:MAG: hypothetical protein ABEJ60_06140 [Halodesulfurarchaeum sp.]